MKLGAAKTVADRIEEHGARVRARLAPAFEAAGIAWPARSVPLVAYKSERRVDLLASDSPAVTGMDWSAMRSLKTYPVLAASGDVGPKLREGDRQVPEGLYAIESLNPMSRFHLALRVAYPNAFDRERAAEDGRTDLGSDIMVHGSDVSVGCLAMGDEAAEELFVVAALAGIENVTLLIAPYDFRARPRRPPPPGAPAWTRTLWERIEESLP